MLSSSFLAIDYFFTLKRGVLEWYALIKKSKVAMRDLKHTRHTYAVQAIKSWMYTLQEVLAVFRHSSLSMLFRLL